MKSTDTYIEYSYEILLECLYGRDGAFVTAGWTSLANLKKSLKKVFRTISQAVMQSVNGDDAHRDELARHCGAAVEAITRSKTKDEVMQRALVYAIELGFHLLGRFPHNSRRSGGDRQSNTHLSTFRTLFYSRTPKQKIEQILDHAFRLPGEYEGSLFERLIRQRKAHRDDLVVLEWIRKNEPKVYEKFNRA